MDHVPAALDDVLITAELARRPTRTRDYEAENRALADLAEAMADSPQTILQKLVETALGLCHADSAGISILEPGGSTGVFRWHAVAGRFASNIGSHAPREGTPSGIVLDRDAPLLFSYPERYFDYGRAIEPTIVEALLVPFHVEGKPVGTLWLIAHTPSRKFDTEDQRVLTRLSRFASMAYQVKTAALTALRAKEDVRQILDTAAIGLTRCSRDLRYLACNRAYEKLLGLPADQIIGRPIIDVMGPKAFEVIRPYIERLLRGERVEFEDEVPISAGGPRFFHVVAEPWFDSEGQVSGWITSVLEITDLKRTTKALREREQRLRLSLDASAAGVWTWDPFTNQSRWDDRFHAQYGFAEGVAQTFDTWISSVHEEDRPTVLAHLDDVLHRHQNEWNIVFRAVRPEGAVVWMHGLGRADRDPEGQVTRMSGINLDITDRRRAEEALQAHRDEERDRTLRLLLETAPQGILSTDARGVIVTANHALEKMFGWGAGELIGQSVEQLVPPALQHRHVAHRTAYFGEPQARLVAGLELAGLRKDGSTFPIELTLNHVATTDGGHAIAFVTDISARKQDQTALQRSHAELEQRTLQLRRLASQLTLAEQTARKQLASTLHDGLQQLLFSAGITLDEAMKTSSQDDQDDQVELLQRARADVKEAMEAARTLSVNLFPPVLHVGGLPAALSWLAKRTQEQYSVVVNVTADPQANPETSDVRILLFEGVRELLFNAVKHARVDRVDVNLALGHGDTIHIEVSDDGVGFDPGAPLHDRNQQQTGLGLFSIQERLALLGGHLDIQSAPGKGSRFTLTLPRTGLPRIAADGTEAQRRDTAWHERLVYDSAGGASKSLRILIADDHAVARAGLRELFGKRSQLQVVGEAASGVEAITQAVALQPDVIVMDVSLPQMNGIDATREIHRTLRHIRIVGLSTHDDESTERLMRKAGAEAYFTKNEGTDRLLDYLLSLLAKTRGASAD
jgi:PAS domain S-box-containing protein